MIYALAVAVILMMIAWLVGVSFPGSSKASGSSAQSQHTLQGIAIGPPLLDPSLTISPPPDDLDPPPIGLPFDPLGFGVGAGNFDPGDVGAPIPYGPPPPPPFDPLGLGGAGLGEPAFDPGHAHRDDVGAPIPYDPPAFDPLGLGAPAFDPLGLGGPPNPGALDPAFGVPYVPPADPPAPPPVYVAPLPPTLPDENFKPPWNPGLFGIGGGWIKHMGNWSHNGKLGAYGCTGNILRVGTTNHLGIEGGIFHDVGQCLIKVATVGNEYLSPPPGNQFRLTVVASSIQYVIRAPPDVTVADNLERRTICVLPSQLNAAEYSDKEPDLLNYGLRHYVFDGTGGPRGQLSADLGVAQFILDNASNRIRDANGLNGINNIKDMGLEPFSDNIKLVNGYLEISGHAAFPDDHPIANHFHDNLQHMTVMGVSDIPVRGVSGPGMNRWDDPPMPKKVDLIYASACPVGTYGNFPDNDFLKRIANDVLLGQYIGALKIAAETPHADVWLMPLGGGVFGNDPKDICLQIIKAMDIMIDKLLANDIRVYILVWGDNPTVAEGPLYRDNLNEARNEYYGGGDFTSPGWHHDSTPTGALVI